MITVPDLPTFTLQDVQNAVASHNAYLIFDGTTISTVPNDFYGISQQSEFQYFNPSYNNDSYAPRRSLLRFRAYGNSNLPTVVTKYSSGLGSTYVTFYGESVDNGTSPITELGFVWDTYDKPIKGASNYISWTPPEWGWLGVYSSYISGLTSNQTYYVRAYAISLEGIAYGLTQTIKTLALSPPIIENFAVINTSATSTFKFTAEVSSEGATSVTARGFVYSTNSNPVIGGAGVTNIVVGSGAGVFYTNTSLTLGSIWYVRAYATNSWGTKYADQISVDLVPVVVEVSRPPVIGAMSSFILTVGVDDPVPGFKVNIISFGTYPVEISFSTSEPWPMAIIYNQTADPTLDNATKQWITWTEQLGDHYIYLHDRAGLGFLPGRYRFYIDAQGIPPVYGNVLTIS